MKKLIVLLVVIICVTLVAGTALAVPKGKSRVFESKMGKVVFSSAAHADAGLKCNTCHSSIFPMKIGSASFTAPHKLDRSCGSCHNGEKAFPVNKNCTMCHKK